MHPQHLSRPRVGAVEQRNFKNRDTAFPNAPDGIQVGRIWMIDVLACEFMELLWL